MVQWPGFIQPFLATLKRLSQKGGTVQPVTGQVAEDEGSSKDPRFDPCDFLLRAGIPCKIWGEDVLCFYGVPTGVFDLFLLVSDSEEASKNLIDQGYLRTTHNKRFEIIPELSSRVPRLVPSYLAAKVMESSSIGSDTSDLLEADDTVLPGVVLLPATDWNYPLPSSVADLHELIPSLHEYFDCTVQKWMDIPETMDSLRSHLAIHIVYHSLYLDEVWTEEFEREIRKEHRQLLFDLLADGTGGPVDLVHRDCQIYHRNIRNQVLEGKFEPAILDTLVRKRVEPENVGTRMELVV